jgi:hypothetical protein
MLSRLPGGSALARAVDRELSAFHFNVWTAQAVLALLAVEEAPHAFGALESEAALGTHDDRAKKLGEKIEALDREQAFITAALRLPEARAILGGGA